MTSERRLWLVRHGETEGQSSIRYHGSNDVPLSDVGREQIRGLLPLLTGVRFAEVVHSPLSRAAESAELLRDGLSLDADLLRVDQRLREIHFGDAEGMTREEIDAAFPSFWGEHEAGRVDAFPGGEPRRAFAERVAAAVTELVATDWRGDMLLVAHRGTVKHAIRTLLGVEHAPQTAFGVELASLSVLRQAGGSWQLDLLGMRP
ncbi:MAG: histidine phosphatase family protein [Planctomycetota bacterium]